MRRIEIHRLIYLLEVFIIAVIIFTDETASVNLAEAKAGLGRVVDRESGRYMEYWDIYDKNKQKTGRIMKRNHWILKDDEYHLSVLGVIKRTDGKYLITQRVMTKAWAPGWWEVSGGGVRAGETSEEAVVREVYEETGLDVSNAKGGFVFSYHRENPGKGDNYFVDIYRFELDFEERDVKIQLEEASDFRIASLEEIRELAKQGIFLHYDSIKKVFED